VDGPPGTRVEKDWLNAIQDEIRNVIEGAGLVLKTASSETGNQLYAAITTLLGIGSPVGAIIAWPTSTLPTGYLECNGAAVSRTTYSSLFAVIFDNYGVGDGSTTFNLPDLRGQFLRGWDHGAGIDLDAASRTDRGDGALGDNVGTKQTDAFESHGHDAPTMVNDVAGTTYEAPPINPKTDNIDYQFAAPTDTTGGNETRPINVNVMYCIRY